MIPSLNNILFLLSTLFGLDVAFIPEETNLYIDFETKTGTIEYIDLQTPILASEYASDGLSTIRNAEGFNTYFTEIRLDSVIFVKQNDVLNATISFSFNRKEDVLKLLQFNETYYGENTASDSVVYHLLPSELLVNSNAEIDSLDGHVVLDWGSKSTIQLHLKQNQERKRSDLKFESLSTYYK